MKKLYLSLAVVGWAGPYYFFLSFLAENGLDLPLLLEQLFANHISAFFAVDLIISAVVFWLFLYQEVQKHQMRHGWVYVVATLTVGPSFALPLFLYVRQRHLETAK